jgi:hypothetical protein
MRAVEGTVRYNGEVLEVGYEASASWNDGQQALLGYVCVDKLR